MTDSASRTISGKKGFLSRMAETSGLLAIAVALFGIHPAMAAKSGFVSNTSGGQNFVDVSDSGQITITPVKKSDGSYTTALNSGALKNFLMTETVFACLNPPPPPPPSGGGGGGGGGSDYTVYHDSNGFFTEHNGQNYSGVCNGNCGSANNPPYSGY